MGSFGNGQQKIPFPTSFTLKCEIRSPKLSTAFTFHSVLTDVIASGFKEGLQKHI